MPINNNLAKDQSVWPHLKTLENDKLLEKIPAEGELQSLH